MTKVNCSLGLLVGLFQDWCPGTLYWLSPYEESTRRDPVGVRQVEEAFTSLLEPSALNGHTPINLALNAISPPLPTLLRRILSLLNLWKTCNPWTPYFPKTLYKTLPEQQSSSLPEWALNSALSFYIRWVGGSSTSECLNFDVLSSFTIARLI